MFYVGKKNWVLINSVKGAQASAVIYSITETAKLNELNPYYYLKYLLERIPELMNAEGASRKRPGTTATMVREPSGQMS